MQKASIKKGFVYTVIIFILGITLVSLMTLGTENRQRMVQTYTAQTDEQILAFRLEELTLLTKDALGVDVTHSRNTTTSILNITDIAFPMCNNTLYGYAYLSNLDSKLSGAWDDTTKTQITYDYSNLNDSGWLIGFSDGLNYYHDNSNSGYDQAFLNIPNTTNITSLNISINCLSPINTSYRRFDDWSNSGTGGRAQIIYSDDYSTTHTDSVIFDFDSNQSFNATYTDTNSSGNWTQTIHIDFKRLDPNNKIQIYSSTNSSYVPPIYKKNVSCNFSIYIETNLTDTEEYTIFFPVNTTLAYGDASYTQKYLNYIRD